MTKTPQAPKVPKQIIQHGQKRIDHYAWIRDDNWKEFIKGDLKFANPAVEKYIKEENAYTQNMMQKHKPLQDELYQEILGRVKEDDQSWPIQKGEYLYYSRTEKGKNYSIYCRKHKTMDAPEEVYFDTNTEAQAYDLYQLKGRQTNKANELLLYGFNTTGSLEVSLRLRNLKTKKEMDWQIDDCNGSFLWIDNQQFLYVQRDEYSRGKNLYLVDIKKGPDKKVLVFSKPAQYENMFMFIDQSSDETYCFINLQSGASGAVFTYQISSQKTQFFREGQNDVSYSLDHWGGHFYILHNENGADHFQIDFVPSSSPERSNWNTLIAEDKTRYLTGFSITNHKIIIEAKNTELALDQLFIHDIKSQKTQQVHFPDDVYLISVFGAYDLFSPTIRLFYETPVSPSQDIDLSLDDLKLKTLYTEEVPNYRPQDYQVKREFALGHDNQKIPLTLISKKSIAKNAKNPAYVCGYGSYGMSFPTYFSQSIFSLVDRGFTVAYAHIRGGDEKGHQWYLDGKMKKKKNTFLDFISACEHLIKQGYTSQKLISANGGSAGGLLMGAVVNMRPDLFKAVVADVAFVDLINTISDESLPLTAPEWEEWGNPITSKEDFQYMMSYSPYDNVVAQDYPAMLFNTGISDEQVTYWEPTKMVAKLRELKTDKNLLLLKVKMHAGHAGASKRYEWIEDRAFNFAFVLSQYAKSE